MSPLKQMFALVFITVLINFSCVDCAGIPIKPFPEHIGVDPRAEPFVKEFKELAKIQGITFKNEVTVGFKTINRGDAIGLCTRGPGWREIDFDSNYFSTATQISKTVTAFHELSHCYCGRSHDWGTGTPYPETASDRLKEVLDSLGKGKTPPGRYTDGCPLSILYPVVLDDRCSLTHYNDYVVEMFQRCEPW